MKIFRFSALVLFGALVGIGAASAPRPAAAQEPKPVPIPTTAAVNDDALKPPTASYYDFQKVNPIGKPGIDSVEIAETFVASHKPDATVVLPGPTIKFPPGPKDVAAANQQTVGTFLLGQEGDRKRKAEGKDASPGWDVALSTRNIFVVRCFIRVIAAGTYSFRVPADDGSVLKIGGAMVHRHFTGGMLGADDARYHARAEFAKPGLYAIELMFCDRGQDIGVVLYSDVDAKGPVRDFGGGLKFTLQPIVIGRTASTQGSRAPETKSRPVTGADPKEKETDAGVRGIPIRYSLASPGKVALVINDKVGKRVRNLIAQADRTAGPQVETWDGRDNEGRVVSEGEYVVQGALTPGLSCLYEFTVYNPGHPPFWTQDNGDPRRNPGGWGSDHFPPGAVAAVGNVIFIGSEAAESGHSIFAVDEDGRKLWGARWINLAGARCLAGDGTYAYMGAEGHWIGNNTRIYQINPKSFETRTMAEFSHENRSGGLSALAARDGLVYAAFDGKDKRIAVYGIEPAGLLREFPAPSISGMAFSPAGQLLAVSGNQVFRVSTDTGKLVPVVTENLLKPHGIASDKNFLYVSDSGDHTVKKFKEDGRFVGTIGMPGGLKAGPYDPRHMSNPRGIDIDSQGRLWVAEYEHQPKKISVWSLAGREPELVSYYLGSGPYGCGHTYIDPRKPSRFFFNGMEFEVDWKTGKNRVKNILSRDIKYTRPIYFKDRLYLVSEPHRFYGGEWGIALHNDGRAMPVARLGPVGQLSEALRTQLGTPDPEKTRYLWSDRSADGEMQADEIETAPALYMHTPWVTRIGGDLALQLHSECLAPTEVNQKGIPIYSFKNTRPTPAALGESPWEGRTYWSMALTRDDKIIEISPVLAVKSRSGEPLWTYPEGNNRCIGIHANKNSPPYAADVLAGTLGVLGQGTLPNLGDFFAVHSNRGEVNFFTVDGLLIGRVFRDNRLGTGGFNFPAAERGMEVGQRSLQQEHFGGTLNQTDDGHVFLVVGHNHSSVVRVDGLDRIQRFKSTVKVSPGALAAVAGPEAVGAEKARAGQLEVERAGAPLRIDADLAEWGGAKFVALKGSDDHRGRAALMHDPRNLYAAFEVRGRPDLVNPGSDMKLLFRSGDSVDIQLGNAGQRAAPMEGDFRLSITRFNGKPAAILYRYVVSGTRPGDRVVYKSPVAETVVDSVTLLDAADIAIKGLPDNGYAVEAAIPWAGLSMKAPQDRLRGDVGILFANASGSGISERVHWSNNQTGLVSDVPGEIKLSPDLWGPVLFK